MSRPRPLVQLALTRWRDFHREPNVLFWAFGFPILLALALGAAFRSRRPDAVRACVAEGPGAAAITQALAGRDDVQADLLSEAACAEGLRAGKADLLIVPGAPRSYRFDPTRPESRVGRLVVDDLLQRAEGRADASAVRDVHVTEPGARYIDFLIPGLIGMGLMQSGLWSVGYAIVDLRTKKLLKRLLATPMKKSDFLASFLIVRVLLLFIEMPILIGFGHLAFGVPIVGSIATLGVVVILGSMVFGGIGLLLASRAQNPQSAGGLINLVSVPMFIGSGTFFASTRFPDAVQPVLRLLPLTALNDALRAVMLEGRGIPAIGAQLGTLALWCVASFALALRLFRWR